MHVVLVMVYTRTQRTHTRRITRNMAGLLTGTETFHVVYVHAQDLRFELSWARCASATP